MGGLYGNAAATALEDCPAPARGLISGMLQQGVSNNSFSAKALQCPPRPGERTSDQTPQYALGYLLCVVFARGLVDTTPHGWRPLFWFAACPPVLIIAFRLCLPENDAYIAQCRVREEAAELSEGSPASAFFAQGKVALKRHWIVLTYLVLLMAGFNFMSHGSQDLYPTLLENQYNFDHDMVTVTQVVANLGAISGGSTVGYLSQNFGRRLSIIVCCVIGGALLYPYTFVSTPKIMAAAFFEQFCVQGAWGVIPIHMMELSPGSLRTFVVGTAYQLGNLASSASSTIESRLGEAFPLPSEEGEEERYEYGRVICIFMGCVFAYTLILALVGPERNGRSFDVEDDEDVVEVAGKGAMEAAAEKSEAEAARKEAGGV